MTPLTCAGLFEWQRVGVARVIEVGPPQRSPHDLPLDAARRMPRRTYRRPSRRRDVRTRADSSGKNDRTGRVSWHRADLRVTGQWACRSPSDDGGRVGVLCQRICPVPANLTLWGPGARPDPFPAQPGGAKLPGDSRARKGGRQCLSTSESMCTAGVPRWRWSTRPGRYSPTATCRTGWSRSWV
jgi:hypothetical protein